MAENKMEEVAKLLGVELDEEFRVYGWDGFCKITELGLERYVKEKSWLMDSIMLTDLIKGTAKIIKLPKPVLTEKEKEYLSNVIKPFRDKVRLISKHSNDNGQFISIEIEEKPHNNNIFFPYFEEGSMYKGMEIGKYYTLEELEL